MMRRLSIHLAAVTIVLLVCSTASAGWTYVAPGWTTYYWSAAPVYTYRAPVAFVEPIPLIQPAPVVIRSAPVVVRSTPVVVRRRAMRRAMRRAWR